MLNEADLVQRYPDLLGGDLEPELMRLVGQLDEVSATYRAAEPPASLMAAIEQLASDRRDEMAHRRPRILVPRGFADANQPPTQASRKKSQPRDRLPGQPHRRWLRQSTEMAAGILVLVLLAGLFVTLLSNQGNLSGMMEPGAQTTPASP
ncbi:MAG TPA: hypothetical protein VFS96_05580, partial [Nitrolancea sp.]|nr:hypothetical protein [Nitrolancea sp.]